MSDGNIIYAAAIPEWFFNKEIISRTADILCIEGKFDKDSVMRYLETKNLHKEVEAFVRTPMVQKWTVTFKDKQALNELSKTSPFECDGCQYTVSPYNGAEYTLRIHRLPPRVPDTRVVQALKEHVEKVVKITREKVTYKRGKPRVVRNVIVEMNWFQLVKLPHRLEIQTHEVLINLRDREPVCLYCNHTGHIRRQCLFERDFHPYLVALESPEHPNATIYVNRDSPLAKSAARASSNSGNRSPPKAQLAPSNRSGFKPRRKQTHSPPASPTEEDVKATATPKSEAASEPGSPKILKSGKIQQNPFSIWPLFGAFIDVKRRHRIIDLRWSLPRNFAACL